MKWSGATCTAGWWSPRTWWPSFRFSKRSPGRSAGVFAGVVMHVPRKTTELLQKEIERLEADSLISFGGGSPIDSCKVAAYGLLPGRELIHIAVPTTLSAV